MPASVRPRCTLTLRASDYVRCTGRVIPATGCAFPLSQNAEHRTQNAEDNARNAVQLAALCSLPSAFYWERVAQRLRELIFVSRFKRVVILVLDSAGVGELPDAERYGDVGSSTLPHAAHAMGGFRVPRLEALGLGRIAAIEGVRPLPAPQGAFGRLAERSAGKDSTTGHWELMGVIVDRPFPTYPHAFPPDLIAAFERAIGTRTLGNEVASGTEIIARLGPQHQRTGYPIVYTSADSVFQVAAHEDVIPPQRLYEICLAARRLLTGQHAVSRVIARPFVGSAGAYTRTDRRRGFSLPPAARTVLDAATAQGVEGVGVR